MWDLSCLDWEDRLRSGRPLIPDLPLVQSEAKEALAIFDELRLPDVPGTPRLGDAAGPWFRDIVAASFGSWDPQLQQRYIRDIFVMAPKGQSKTSYSAGLTLTAALMNLRPRAEMLYVGPTQAISDRAYDQVAGMIECDRELKKRFRPRDHIKTIEDRLTKAELKVKTFDVNILTGSILVMVMLDELHLLGRNVHTTKVLRQIRGGLEKTPEGLLLITTTQSDEAPIGAFRDELVMARRIRDGEFRGQVIRPMLPVLHEFPRDIASDRSKWEDPSNWWMVMPNLGRSVHLESLKADWASEREKGEANVRVWASQHLNIEVGIGLSGSWIGVPFWAGRADPTLTLDALLDRCEVAIVGIDGGGADDLLGLAVLGRDRETKDWLAWSHAWCHSIVLERRKSIAARLMDFAAAGELTIEDDSMAGLREVVSIVQEVKDRGLLGMVAVDPAGLGEIVDAMADIGVTEEAKLLGGVMQGYGLMSAIKGVERKLINGTLSHSGSSLMAWCAGNLKIEPTATAIRATKANAGDAKIDPMIALFNAATVMARNPEAAGRSVYEQLAAEAQSSPEPRRDRAMAIAFGEDDDDD